MNNFITISEARHDLPQLVKKVSKGHEVTITVNGKPMATLIATDELESIMETAEILAIPGAKKEIKEGLEQAKRGEGIPLSELD